MGCAASKVDDLSVSAVALCRDRCSFLDEAIEQRSALAQAHLAYTRSLKLIASSLPNFIRHDLACSSAHPAVQPHHLLFGHTSAAGHHSSPSDSGSHIILHSDADSHSLHDSESDHSSPLHSHASGHMECMTPPMGFLHVNSMKKLATLAVIYQQRPMIPRTMYVGESSSSSSHYTKDMNSGIYSNNYGGYNDYPPYGSTSPQPTATASSSKKPPPPPFSPPRASAWDLLNPFESCDQYYPTYTHTPSRDSRAEERVPGLGDADNHHPVAKQVHGDQKFIGTRSRSKSLVHDEDEKAALSVLQVKNYGEERESHVVDKKVVNGKRSESGAGPRDVYQVAREIKVQFVRASESGNEIARMLEVEDPPYQRKHDSSKKVFGVTPSLSVVSPHPSTPKLADFSSSKDKPGAGVSKSREDLAMSSEKLSSTMLKLYLWEKKLYNEVKIEERVRIAYERECRKLKLLDEKGAGAHKVDLKQTLIRSLSTKIKISVHIIDSLSVTISKIRDEELWPQLCELIQGLSRMWKSMLDCHLSQSQAIREATGIGSIGCGNRFSDAHLEATLHLEHDIIKWTSEFHSWIHAQRGYAKALKGWLLKSLLYEPEDARVGRPLSPGRMGAPLIFVICKQWSDGLQGISEKEVLDSMYVFAIRVLQLWEQDKVEMQQRMMANKASERHVKYLDREDQKIKKEIQRLGKQIVLASGHSVHQGDNCGSSLHESLERMFEVTKKFAADSMKVYEELLQRMEEERIDREHE